MLKHLKIKSTSKKRKTAKTNMSEEYEADDHQNESLYCINTSGFTWWKESDVKDPKLLMKPGRHN